MQPLKASVILSALFVKIPITPCKMVNPDELFLHCNYWSTNHVRLGKLDHLFLIYKILTPLQVSGHFSLFIMKGNATKLSYNLLKAITYVLPCTAFEMQETYAVL